jgi:hypothetical protein
MASLTPVQLRDDTEGRNDAITQAQTLQASTTWPVLIVK